MSPWIENHLDIHTTISSCHVKDIPTTTDENSQNELIWRNDLIASKMICLISIFRFICTDYSVG